MILTAREWSVPNMILFKYLDDNCLYPYNICTMLKIVDIEWLFDEETDTSKEGSLLDINTGCSK